MYYYLVFASAMTSGTCGGDVEEWLRLPGLQTVLHIAKLRGKVDQESVSCGTYQVGEKKMKYIPIKKSDIILYLPILRAQFKSFWFIISQEKATKAQMAIFFFLCF